jgi:8-oxo-dGTP diphosphatase
VSRVFLVRHADAEDRAQFAGDDRLRPLAASGRAQAQRLVGRLEEFEVTDVASSPALRCVETIAPLAVVRDLDVALNARLAEDADPADVVSWLLGLGDGGHVAASHGEPLASVVQLLVERGASCRDPLRCQKASTWILDVRDGVPTTLRYLPPA